METHLIYHINKRLGIVSRELSGHLDLTMGREDRCDKRYALMCGEGATDQLFPSRVFTVHDEAVKSNEYTIFGINEKLTG